MVGQISALQLFSFASFFCFGQHLIYRILFIFLTMRFNQLNNEIFENTKTHTHIKPRSGYAPVMGRTRYTVLQAGTTRGLSHRVRRTDLGSLRALRAVKAWEHGHTLNQLEIESLNILLGARLQYCILLFFPNPYPKADSWQDSLYTHQSIQGRHCQNPNETSESQAHHIHPGIASSRPLFPPPPSHPPSRI